MRHGSGARTALRHARGRHAGGPALHVHLVEHEGAAGGALLRGLGA